MKSITQDNHQMESLNQKIATFFEQYAIGKLLRTANTNKLKGIPAMQVFLLVVCTVFRQGSLYMQMHLPSLDDKMSVIPYTTRVDAHFLHNNMDYAITATFDFICRMSPREKIRASIFSPTA